jgi:hypothetical protein
LRPKILPLARISGWVPMRVWRESIGWGNRACMRTCVCACTALFFLASCPNPKRCVDSPLTQPSDWSKWGHKSMGCCCGPPTGPVGGCLPWPPYPYLVCHQLHRERAVTGRIFQALPNFCPHRQINGLLLYIKLVGTRDLRTLWSPPTSLNQERHTQLHHTNLGSHHPMSDLQMM